MGKTKAESATSVVALLGFLTAFSGLAQTMWTTAPWWQEDGDAVASIEMPMSDGSDGLGDMDDDVTDIDTDFEDDSEMSWGGILLIVGGIALTTGSLSRLMLFRRRKLREDDEKQMVA